MTSTRLLAQALVALALLCLAAPSLAQDPEAAAAPQAETSMIIIPLPDGPSTPPTGPPVFPNPACSGDSSTTTPAFERLATEPYKQADVQAMLDQTIQQVAAKRQELDDAIADPNRAWAAYKSMYGLNFGNARVDLQRKANFTNNLRRWKGLNDELLRQQDDTMAYGLTRFADMSPEEFKAVMLPDFPRPSITAPGRRLLGRGDGGDLTCSKYVDWDAGILPPLNSWDWRAAGSITPVRDQAGCGSCSNFAATATIENTWIRKWWSLGYRSWNTDLAEQDFLDCTSGNQCKGSWPDSVMDRYICKGAAFEAALPYKAADMYTCKDKSVLKRYLCGAKSFMYVPPGSDNLARAVMKAPTVIGVDASNWQGLAAGWVRNCGEPNTGLNHGVAVVGWVDNVKMTNGQTWDYWIIKNSWGTGFCNNGYIWVRKDCAAPGPYGMYSQNHWVPNKG